MKLLYILILYIINLSIKNINCEQIPFCCCFYNKDAFRGFQTSSIEILYIKNNGLDKSDIGNSLMHMCMNKNGFPSIENIERLKSNILILSDKKCKKECEYLIRELNDKYNIKQEENRKIEGKKLKQSLSELKKKINNQIQININSLYNGKKCDVTIGSKINSKNNNNNILNLRNNLILSDSNINNNDNESINVNNLKKNDEDIISFDSVSLSSHHSLEDPELEKALNAYEDTNNNDFKGIKIVDSIDINNLKNNQEILKEIDELKLKIMYLDKKNSKPIDFILERFTIKDNILVMIIKIFEKTLEEVINNMKIYFEEQIYFQFKIVENPNNI